MASIEEINAAFIVINDYAVDETDFTDREPEVQQAGRTLLDAIAELAALREWKAKAAPLLKALAETALIEYDVLSLCPFCTFDEYMLPKELGHTDDCPVTQARALLNEGNTP